jgi:hypothetical protein
MGKVKADCGEFTQRLWENVGAIRMIRDEILRTKRRQA